MENIAEIGGMHIETNGSGEIFISKEGVQLRIGSMRSGIRVSYMNQPVVMVPANYRTIDFLPQR